MRKFRTLDIEILALPNITPELKLILCEVLSWSDYYQNKKNSHYRYNPAQVSYAIGLPIYDVVLLIDRLVTAKIISVGDDNGYSTLYPTHEISETVRLLSVLN